MVLIHVLGGALVLVGLIVFVIDQMKGLQGESTMSAWKLNLSGPPALVLIVIGALVFLFPFSPWFNSDPGTPAGTTIPEEISITPDPVSATDRSDPPPTEVLVLPNQPTGPDIYYHDDCAADVIEWFQDDIENVDGWSVTVEQYDPVNDALVQSFEYDTARDAMSLLYGNSSAVCYWEFVDPNRNYVNHGGGYYYYLYIYAYNDSGYSEQALSVDYYDY